MAIKTFTTGEVLTAADTNTYLANSGLVYVTSVAVTTATTAINNCFTSTYSNYQVVMNITSDTGGAAQIQIQMRAGGTPTGGAAYYGRYTGTTWAGSVDDVGMSAASNWFAMRVNGDTKGFGGTVNFQNPQLAARTFIETTGSDGAQRWIFGGLHDSATQFDGFQIYNSGGSSMTGTITVYGYRKA
jgi:hypothetical protein